MFIIIEIPQNYFLHANYYSSNVAFHFSKSLAVIFGGKLFGGSVLSAQYCPWSVQSLTLVSSLVLIETAMSCHPMMMMMMMMLVETQVQHHFSFVVEHFFGPCVAFALFLFISLYKPHFASDTKIESTRHYC